MNWYEMISILFIGIVIVLVAVGALKAFGDFYRGRHHDS